MATDIDEFWRRIVANEGNEFHTTSGKAFTYETAGHVLRVFRDGKEINQNISISNFEKVMPHLPLEGPGVISDLVRGSSYVYAIMSDVRIKD